jgi:CHAT domain-containing protein
MTAVAHGFLHVGARAVVTALWDVNDLPAALLVCALYSSPSIHADPAAALSEAQNWLRTLTPRTAGQSTPWLPAELAGRLRQYLERLDTDEAPFAEGIDWGAFADVGP